MVIDKSVWSFIDRNTIMTVIYHLNSQTYSLVIGPRERSERGPTKPLLLSTPTKCIQKCQKNHHF